MPIKTTKKSTGAKTPVKANDQKGEKVCTCCHAKKKLTDYYYSASPMYSLDQRIPVCKECCKTSALYDDGTINYPKLKENLMHTDKPLYYDSLFSAKQSIKKENSFISEEEVELHGYEVLQKYYTLIAMRQDKSVSYMDSQSQGHIHPNSNKPESERVEIVKKYGALFGEESLQIGGQVTSSKAKAVKEIVIEQPSSRKKEKPVIIDDDDFEVTDEMIELFGDGYLPSIYKKMFDKYEKLKLNYSLQTNIHQEALATYVRFKVHEEIATSKGNIEDAKKWYDAAQKSAQDAKLTPKQLSKADLDSGVNSISEIVKAVEQATDVIKIMPRFKYRPNDAPDFNIWCYVNYERNLNDMPNVDYEDVYKFYDKRKEEYIAQNGDPYGIFNDDTAKRNRENVKTFIQLPDDYDELAGDGND